MQQLWYLSVLGLVSALLVAGAALFPKVHAWLALKLKASRYEGVVSRLTELVFRVVTELNQTVVDQLKKDGRWNKEEAAKVKKLALEKLKSYLGAAGLQEIMNVLFGSSTVGNVIQLETLLSTYIESQVQTAKLT